MQISFYDSFIGQFYAQSFNQAETYCNDHGGGMLASFHSEEEVNFAQTATMSQCKMSGNGHAPNMGLRCTGTNCKWDDGSAVTYLNFPFGGPPDDSKTRCYSLGDRCNQSSCISEWQEKECGPELGVCWFCSVKSRTIECSDGEVEYKGGCVSVHSAPHDQKSAEESCPDGGKIISIHGDSDNKFYKNVALNAGLNGTIYTGGRFTNGVFEWSDGSHYNVGIWAPSFPNTIFGSCTQMLLASEFGNQGQWTNIDCNSKLPYLCFRDGADYGPALPTELIPPQPQADSKCPPIQYYTEAGKIFSPNFPLSIPAQQTCEYVIGTEEDTRASLQFKAFDCQLGTTLELFDGLNSNVPFLTFTTSPPALNKAYTSSSNVLKMVFTANGTTATVGTGWEAEFRGA